MTEFNAACLRDPNKAFAATVNDLTDHTAKVTNSGVTIFISVNEFSGATSTNTLAEIVRSYNMEFYTASLTDGSEHILRFGKRVEQ